MEYMSQEGYDKLVAELHHLKTVEYPKVKEALSEARDKGDLSENFEYHAAKREQARLISRIRFKQRVLNFARVLDTSRLDSGIVGLLSGFTLFGGVNGNYKMKLGGYAYNFRQHSKMKLNRKQDVLVNKFVHTRHIPRPQPSSGGGHGGHSSGGGSSIHIGSGGHTFGGGGRKF